MGWRFLALNLYDWWLFLPSEGTHGPTPYITTQWNRITKYPNKEVYDTFLTSIIFERCVEIKIYKNQHTEQYSQVGSAFGQHSGQTGIPEE
jgi:hypothetical protein